MIDKTKQNVNSSDGSNSTCPELSEVFAVTAFTSKLENVNCNSQSHMSILYKSTLTSYIQLTTG